MCPFPVDPEPAGAADELVMSKPDELRDLAAKLRFVGRLQEQITSQAAMARAGRPSWVVDPLADQLVVRVALDEEGLPGREAGGQAGVARQDKPGLRHRQPHEPG